jgi:hypothetical protein
MHTIGVAPASAAEGLLFEVVAARHQVRLHQPEGRQRRNIPRLTRLALLLGGCCLRLLLCSGWLLCCGWGRVAPGSLAAPGVGCR